MMAVNNLKRTILTDTHRAMCSKKFPLAIGIVILVLSVAAFEGVSMNEDVLYVFSIVMYGMPAMIILIAGAFIYGDSLCLDVEHKYITSAILRSGVRNYVVSKVVTIFLHQ